MKLDDCVTVTVEAWAASPAPRRPPFCMTQGALEPAELLSDLPDASGLYALRLSGKACRFVLRGGALLHVPIAAPAE